MLAKMLMFCFYSVLLQCKCYINEVDILCEQQACGFEYTSKLQRMFQDVSVSKELNDQFRDHLKKTSEEPLDSEYLDFPRGTDS